MSSPPRTFSVHDLTCGITCGQYLALPESDRLAFDRALVALWAANARAEAAHDLASDYDLIGTNRRFEYGE